MLGMKRSGIVQILLLRPRLDFIKLISVASDDPLEKTYGLFLRGLHGKAFGPAASKLKERSRMRRKRPASAQDVRDEERNNSQMMQAYVQRRT